MDHYRLRNLVAQHTGVVAGILTIGIGDVQATQSSSWQHVRLDTTKKVGINIYKDFYSYYDDQ